MPVLCRIHDYHPLFVRANPQSSPNSKGNVCSQHLTPSGHSWGQESLDSDLITSSPSHQRMTPPRGHFRAGNRSIPDKFLKHRSKLPGPQGIAGMTRSQWKGVLSKTLMWDDARNLLLPLPPRDYGGVEFTFLHVTHFLERFTASISPGIRAPVQRQGGPASLYTAVKAGGLSRLDSGNRARGAGRSSNSRNCWDYNSGTEVNFLLIWGVNLVARPKISYILGRSVSTIITTAMKMSMNSRQFKEQIARETININHARVEGSPTLIVATPAYNTPRSHAALQSPQVRAWDIEIGATIAPRDIFTFNLVEE